ncbi:hypothetical protein NDU88_004443 [Pleurodeles waltl]|uniref:Uncharacterized protein n=1 Tax=Pleurodeles waltl TaxID=8319 RepID=A0AAV7TU93_PLEWA|nr:hypothetical protein NDU88_004443 [Pleurodeles waltl]
MVTHDRTTGFAMGKRCKVRQNSGKLEDYITRLFCHMDPDLAEQDIVLDHTHRAGRPAKPAGMPQDIRNCLHYYRQKMAIMLSVRDCKAIDFEEANLWLYQDLSLMNLKRHRTLLPITEVLRDKGIR